MKTWIVEFEALMAVRVPTMGGQDSEFSHMELKQLSQTILTPDSEIAVAYVTAKRQHSERFKINSVLPGPEIDAIIPIDHGLGGNLR